MTTAAVRSYAAEFASVFESAPGGVCDTGFAVPFTLLAAAKESFAGVPVRIGAQNVHWLDAGPHTGEISPLMLLEYGTEFALVGHSERRQLYGETDECVALRAKAAITRGMTAVVCVGETREQFETEQSWDVVRMQLLLSLSTLQPEDSSRLIVAYEPVWAIGTGLSATPAIASQMHAKIHSLLGTHFGKEPARVIPIIYGGSTTPENVAALLQLTHVDGALVGGASLTPATFNELIRNGRRAFHSRT